MENSMRSSSSISVRQLAKSAAKGGVGQCIRTTLPYIRSDVPVLIVFKALGFVVRQRPTCPHSFPHPHSFTCGPGCAHAEAVSSP